MKRLVPLLMLMAGCERPPTSPTNAVAVYPPPASELEGARFTVETQGGFKAGYENTYREILIITDTKTGRTYLGVTGVGISELMREKAGKTTVTRER